MNGTKILKYALLTVDVIILLSGLIMLIAGSGTTTRMFNLINLPLLIVFIFKVGQGTINNDKLSHTIGGYSTQAGTIICILFGLAIMGFGVVGIFATTKDNHALLVFYGSVMSLIFLIQIITGITGLSVRNSANFNSYVDNVFAAEFKINSTMSTERDFYQENFKCCGWKSFNDYLSNEDKLQIPSSCCIDKTCDTTTGKNVFSNGCNVKLYDASRFVIETACSILVTFSLINLVSIILSFILSRQIRIGYQYA